MTLFRRFRDHFGHAPMKLIQRRRLDLAKEILATSREPIVNIALDCGFTDTPHFSRTFKKETGLTPGQYREQHRMRNLRG
jgi:AraC family transcriptional regulator